MLHANDAQSVRMLVQKNPEKVFQYTETNLGKPVKVEGQLDGGNMPFTIGIQIPWQLEMMAKYKHGGGVSIDATFGTNDKKVSHSGGCWFPPFRAVSNSPFKHLVCGLRTRFEHSSQIL